MSLSAARRWRGAQLTPLGLNRRRRMTAEPLDALLAAWRALGTAQRMLGRYSDAEASFRAALAAATAAGATPGLEVASIHNDLGMTHKLQGRFAEAAGAYDAALAILGALPDTDPDDLASLWHNLGGLAHAQGDHQSAEPLARRAIEVRTARPRPGPRRNAAGSQRARGDPRRARTVRRSRGRDPPRARRSRRGPRGRPSRGCRRPQQPGGDRPAARCAWRRPSACIGWSSPPVRRSSGRTPRALAVALSNLGTVLRAQGRPEAARAAYERAIDLLEGVVDASHPSLATIHSNLARVVPPASVASGTSAAGSSGQSSRS